jgi:hypothetical protein
MARPRSDQASPIAGQIGRAVPLLFVFTLTLAAQTPPIVLTVDRAISPAELQIIEQMTRFAARYEAYARMVQVGHIRNERVERELVAAWDELAHGPAQLPVEARPNWFARKFHRRGD